MRYPRCFVAKMWTRHPITREEFTHTITVEAENRDDARQIAAQLTVDHFWTKGEKYSECIDLSLEEIPNPNRPPDQKLSVYIRSRRGGEIHHSAEIMDVKGETFMEISTRELTKEQFISMIRRIIKEDFDNSIEPDFNHENYTY